MSNATDQELWGVHLIGPDDLLACASRADAVTEAERINTFIQEHYEREREHDDLLPKVKAEVVVWPYDAESHAEDLTEFGGHFE